MSSDLLTNEYRTNILNLVSNEFCNTKTGWHISQHIMDQFWARHQTNHSHNIDKKNSIQSSSCVTLCQECGYMLHPGVGGTTIRTKRPSHPFSASARKTIRRREQRKRKRARIAKSAGGNNRGRQINAYKQENDSAISKAGIQPALIDNDPNLTRLDRNCLILTCGRCHGKYNLKGPKRSVGEGTSSSQLQSKKHISDKQCSTNQKRKIKSDSSPFASSGFEPLPSVTEVKMRKNSQNTTSNPSINVSNPATQSQPLTLLEQKQEEKFGRKKKKRNKKDSNNPRNSKNNLMNFLSSLNDP